MARQRGFGLRKCIEGPLPCWPALGAEAGAGNNPPMQEQISILGLDDKDGWEAQVRTDGLPSQSWSYARGLGASGCRAQLAVVRSGSGRLLIPFFERPWRGATDIATIPGLSGASVAPGSERALGLWREYAAQRGWVAGYIQLAVSAVIAGEQAKRELHVHNTVHVLDAQAWDLYRSVSRKFRQCKLYEGKRRKAVLETDRDRLAAALAALYPESMKRLGAAEEFTAETLTLWAHDSDALPLAAVVDGEIEAIHLSRFAGAHGDCHVSATTASGRGLGAWLVWSAFEQLKLRGVRWFNIGGGGELDDGLSRYKQRFNATRMPLRSLHQVYDARRYAELCELEGATPGGQWFPAYRSAHGRSFHSA